MQCGQDFHLLLLYKYKRHKAILPQVKLNHQVASYKMKRTPDKNRLNLSFKINITRQLILFQLSTLVLTKS